MQQPFKFFQYLFLALFFTGFYSCKEKVVQEQYYQCEQDWNDIQKKEILTVLAENSPASYFLYKGKNMGYEYELLHEFAKDMDIRLQVLMVHNLDSIYNKLNNCEGDLIACNLTKTLDRENEVKFSVPHTITHQVLVQRNHKDSLVKEIEQLKDKEIFVWQNSSYYQQLVKLNELLNLDITIIPIEGDYTSEELIQMVSSGKIDYTITDENVAKINASYYKNINIDLKISDEQEIAFAGRKNSSKLIDTLNYWLTAKENQSTIGEVKRKYFKRRNLTQKAITDYSTVIKEGQLSPYDDIIKKESETIGWDWRLISSIVYQESKFETWKESWAGAYGLFQFMPATASSYGINRNSSAEAQLKAGVRKLNKNYNQWLEIIPDSTEAIYFTLANFNAGRAHIDDARALAKKHGKNPNKWHGHVNEMILNLSKPIYYKDPVVKYGYMRGLETYEYIYEVMERFEEYKHAFPDSVST